MSKLFQSLRMNDLRLGALVASTALVALIAATPVAPASAQSAPAGLLRLDPPQPTSEGVKLTEDQRAKVRGAYARSRKPQPQQ